MHLLPILIILVVILAIALAVLKAKGSLQEGTSKPDVYFLKESLFTPAERSF